MKCKQCGYEWRANRCTYCGIGTVGKNSFTLSDKDYKCDYCGQRFYSEYPTGFRCPKCGYKERKPSSDCFITTACVRAKGLPDDCYELTTLRRFRDEVLLKSPDLKGYVEDYYQKAPLIIAEIDKLDNSLEIYERIYNEMILPSVRYVDEKEEQRAIELYYGYYMELLKKYLK